MINIHWLSVCGVGYKLCARIYLNGDGMGKNSHISLFIVVMKGKFVWLLLYYVAQVAVILCCTALLDAALIFNLTFIILH
jgi:hypothetical protein